MSSKLLEVRVPITEMPKYVGGEQIKTDGLKRHTQTDVITH